MVNVLQYFEKMIDKDTAKKFSAPVQRQAGKYVANYYFARRFYGKSGVDQGL
jgi:hypothetical protein